MPLVEDPLRKGKCIFARSFLCAPPTSSNWLGWNAQTASQPFNGWSELEALSFLHKIDCISMGVARKAVKVRMLASVAWVQHE